MVTFLMNVFKDSDTALRTDVQTTFPISELDKTDEQLFVAYFKPALKRIREAAN